MVRLRHGEPLQDLEMLVTGIIWNLATTDSDFKYKKGIFIDIPVGQDFYNFKKFTRYKHPLGIYIFTPN